MKTDLKIKYLQINDEKEYEEDFTFIFKELRVKYEIINSHSFLSNEKTEHLNQIL